MKKLCSIFVALVISVFCFGQAMNKKCGFFIVDIDYKGTIALLDKPGGKLIKDIQHHVDEEDFLVMNVLDKKGWMEPGMQCDNPYTTCN